MARRIAIRPPPAPPDATKRGGWRPKAGTAAFKRDASGDPRHPHLEERGPAFLALDLAPGLVALVRQHRPAHPQGHRLAVGYIARLGGDDGALARLDRAAHDAAGVLHVEIFDALRRRIPVVRGLAHVVG